MTQNNAINPSTSCAVLLILSSHIVVVDILKLTEGGRGGEGKGGKLNTHNVSYALQQPYTEERAEMGENILCLLFAYLRHSV